MYALSLNSDVCLSFADVNGHVHDQYTSVDIIIFRSRSILDLFVIYLAFEIVLNFENAIDVLLVISVSLLSFYVIITPRMTE